MKIHTTINKSSFSTCGAKTSYQMKSIPLHSISSSLKQALLLYQQFSISVFQNLRKIVLSSQAKIKKHTRDHSTCNHIFSVLLIYKKQICSIQARGRRDYLSSPSFLGIIIHVYTTLDLKNKQTKSTFVLENHFKFLL